MLRPLGRMTALPVTAPVPGFALHFLSRVFESFGEAQNSLCVQEVIALEREEAAARDSPGGGASLAELAIALPGAWNQNTGVWLRMQAFFFSSLSFQSPLACNWTSLPSPPQDM